MMRQWRKRRGAALYVGESGDIRARLLDHLQSDDAAVRQAPTHFAYELVPAQAARLVREKVVIRELNPESNAEPAEGGVVGA